MTIPCPSCDLDFDPTDGDRICTPCLVDRIGDGNPF